jgi:hypothetical protein
MANPKYKNILNEFQLTYKNEFLEQISDILCENYIEILVCPMCELTYRPNTRLNIDLVNNTTNFIENISQKNFFSKKQISVFSYPLQLCSYTIYNATITEKLVMEHAFKNIFYIFGPSMIENSTFVLNDNVTYFSEIPLDILEQYNVDTSSIIYEPSGFDMCRGTNDVGSGI